MYTIMNKELVNLTSFIVFFFLYKPWACNPEMQRVQKDLIVSTCHFSSLSLVALSQESLAHLAES